MVESDIKTELNLLLRARYPVISISAKEEEPAKGMIESVCNIRKKKLFYWSETKGKYGVNSQNTGEYEPMGPDEVLNWFSSARFSEMVNGEVKEHTRAILVLLDYDHFMEDPSIQRLIKEVHGEIKNTMKNIILLSPNPKIPDNLSPYIHYMDIPLPNFEEIKREVLKTYSSEWADEWRLITKNADSDALSTEIALKSAGLSLGEVEQLIKESVVRKSFNINDITRIKKQKIEKSGVLSYYDVSSLSLSDLGGLNQLKMKISKLPRRFSKDAEKYGIKRPKGFIAIGPPGTGKSLSAKITAATLGVPLIVISMSQIASKWYGESTSNLASALKLIEALSPVVVLFDEIEKMLPGNSGEMHEESGRMFSELLTFINDCTAPIFWVGTCNSYQELRAELLQRFELMVFCDLPNRREREEIWNIHIRKTGRNPKNFDISRISQQSNGFVGREIEVMLKEAMESGFDDNMREFTTSDIINQISRSVPTSRQKKETIDAMRNWAKTNCMLASDPETEQENTPNGVYVET